MRKALRLVLVLGALALAIAAVAVLAHRSSSRNALQEYRAELRAKGEKLTFQELGPSFSTNGTESTRNFLNAAANLSLSGSSPGIVGVMEYIGPGTARVAWAEANARLSSVKDDTTTTWAGLAEQVDAAEDVLLRIRESLGKPDVDMGWDQKDVLSRPRDDFITKRNAAKWLAGAVVTEIHRGRLDEAAKNLHSLAAVTQMQREELTLANQFIRIAIGSLGLATTWEALQTNGWSDAQLARMQDDCESVNFLAAVEKGFLGERAHHEAIMALIRTNKNQKIGPMSSEGSVAEIVVGGILSLVWQPDEDERFYLQNMQATLDSVRALAAHRPWTEVKAKLDDGKADIDRIGRSITKYRYLISLISIPNTTRGVDTALRNETERQLAIAAIAIKRYQLRQGKAPPSLLALAPEFLAAVPIDPMSGQPLRYRLNADGSFVLYSVGEDGRDDGGDTNPPQPVSQPDLWSGRDAVWPAPAVAAQRSNNLPL